MKSFTRQVTKSRKLLTRCVPSLQVYEQPVNVRPVRFYALSSEQQEKAAERLAKAEDSMSPGEDNTVRNVAILGVIGLACISMVWRYWTDPKSVPRSTKDTTQDPVTFEPLVDLGTKPHFGSNVTSLLSKYLTDDVWRACKDKKSVSGAGFDVAINSGVKNPDSGVGVYAPDEESYTVFAPLFDKVINDYHGGYTTKDTHQRNLNPEGLVGSNPDPEGKYVLSTRIRVGRNLADFPLNPSVTREQRQQIEKAVTGALSTLTGDLAGHYYPLTGMDESTRQQLVDDHFLFKKGDRFLEAAGCNRDWPESRGIFHSDDKKFLVWVNEEDQLRIISMQMGSDVKEVFSRLSRAIQIMEQKVKFGFNDHLGFISSCPTNLGTAMRASVHIKIPNVSKHPDFKTWAAHHNLSVRGIHGEHSESAGGVYDISNKRRLGLSEVDCANDLLNGVEKLIAWEKRLEAQL